MAVKLKNTNPDKKQPVVEDNIPKMRHVSGPGFSGTLPFLPASVLLTDYEKKHLKGLGWKEGDPIPNLSREVSAAMEEAQTEALKVPVTVGKNQPVKMPAIVDIDELSEEKQNAIKDMIASATANIKSGKPMPEEDDEPFIPSAPGVADAIRVASDVANRKARESEIEEAVIGGETKEQPKTDTGTSAVTNSICTHCGWDKEQSDNVDPSKEDKVVFVTSIISQGRFTKTYDLLGGQFKVTFRTLLAKENDTIIKQMIYDWNNSKISGPAHSLQQSLFYEQALSIQEVTTAGGPLKLETLDEYDGEPDHKDSTILPDVVDFVTERAMPVESVRKIIGQAFVQFKALVNKLEAMAQTPDFYPATEN